MRSDAEKKRVNLKGSRHRAMIALPIFESLEFFELRIPSANPRTLRLSAFSSSYLVNAASASASARASAAALLTVSWYSASCCESATIPPLAWRW